jgi:DNA processing protein
MQVTEEQRRLLTICAIRLDGKSIDWSLIAREATKPAGVDRLYEGQITERSDDAVEARPLLRRGLRHLEEPTERVSAELATAEAHGARLITVLDDTYPATLRLVWNLPPFLFVLGDRFRDGDLRSVAIVGTRDATDKGLAAARHLTELLVERDVTVVSGLARGIDTASHTAAVDAGGRTVAVVGTGITKTYPAENRQLAERITGHGAVVSQFWPTAGPARWTFPRRNVVMSGIAQGTVVVEASATSGAKMQARVAHEHGKQVFLLHSLVTDQPWARRYVDQGKAVEVTDVEDVAQRLASPERITQVTTERQLSLDLVK